MVSLRLLVVLSGVMFFAVLFGAVAIQAQRIEGQRQIDQLDRDIGEQRDRYRSLRAQVAENESPERIMAEARELDMVEPGPVAPLIAGVAITPTTEVPVADTAESAESAESADTAESGPDPDAQISARTPTSSSPDAGGGSGR